MINRSRPVCAVDPRRDAPRSEPPHRGLERARSHRYRRHPCSLRVTSVRGQHPSIHFIHFIDDAPTSTTTDDRRSVARSTDRPTGKRACVDGRDVIGSFHRMSFLCVCTPWSDSRCIDVSVMCHLSIHRDGHPSRASWSRES